MEEVLVPALPPASGEGHVTGPRIPRRFRSPYQKNVQFRPLTKDEGYGSVGPDTLPCCREGGRLSG